MLVLTRKRDESIIIGDNVRVTVVDVRGDQVKIGIDAPRSVPVHREEVYQEIRQGNRRASSGREGALGEEAGTEASPSAPPGT